MLLSMRRRAVLVDAANSSERGMGHDLRSRRSVMRSRQFKAENKGRVMTTVGPDRFHRSVRRFGQRLECRSSRLVAVQRKSERLRERGQLRHDLILSSACWSPAGFEDLHEGGQLQLF
jgi:hypothetical protein